jgi:hypothetical protein
MTLTRYSIGFFFNFKRKMNYEKEEISIVFS